MATIYFMSVQHQVSALFTFYLSVLEYRTVLLTHILCGYYAKVLSALHVGITKCRFEEKNTFISICAEFNFHVVFYLWLLPRYVIYFDYNVLWNNMNVFAIYVSNLCSCPLLNSFSLRLPFVWFADTSFLVFLNK